MNGVLFLCVHNSARSQMAEEYFRRFSGGAIPVESAGLEPGKLNPYVVRALAEDGIDIAGKKTQAVADLRAAGRSYAWIVTVCSQEAAERCPVFPGKAERRHWPFDDPASFTGSDAEIMARVRAVRDQIREAASALAAEVLGTIR